ncbi:TPA: hypothetical protein ACFRG8_000889 [Neisseria lactamica]
MPSEGGILWSAGKDNAAGFAAGGIRTLRGGVRDTVAYGMPEGLEKQGGRRRAGARADAGFKKLNAIC